MSLGRVEEWISKLSAWERAQLLVIVDAKAYTPNRVVSEVRAGTDLGRRLQAKVEAGAAGLSDAGKLKELAKLRLKRLFKERPVEIAAYSLERPKITSQELAGEVEKETPLGKEWIETEIQKMRMFMEV